MPPADSPGPAALIVEDDPDLLAVLARILTGTGFRVHTAEDGDAALRQALDLAPAVLIVDVNLPALSGVEVTRELRRRGVRTPVLLLTARGSVADRVDGLDAGADDYLAKPFEPPELVARVRALVRRATLTAADAVLRAGDLTLDPLARRVERAGQVIELTQREYALLEYLVRHAGYAVSRRAIAEHVWRDAGEQRTNVVDVYINYLRKKLHPLGPPLIHTVRGVGYMVRG